LHADKMQNTDRLVHDEEELDLCLHTKSEVILTSSLQAGTSLEGTVEEPCAEAVQFVQEEAYVSLPVDGPLLMPTAGDMFCFLQGQVLITAPHSLKLERGGAASGEKVRTHLRERWTAEIALALARELSNLGLPASVMVWNRTARPRGGRLDPNFLTREQFHLCPWHCALHRWLLGSKGLPLLHIDFHGKNEPDGNADCLDLGMAPLERSWPVTEQGFVLTLKHRLKKYLDKALTSHGVTNGKGQPLKVDSKPTLNGFWGKQKLKTLSHQSALLGIPSIQLEVPPRLRQRFIDKPELYTAFAAAISQAFQEVIIPWWSARAGKEVAAEPRPLLADAGLAEKVWESDSVNPSNFSSWCSQLYTELVQ